MYAIVDIETTGGFSVPNRITEVAVVVHDGLQVVEEYRTLVNPGRTVPGFITGLTGISTEMVREAPGFDEIADELHALLKDKVFVAHNVTFDYSFIKAEFKRVGLEFNRPKLCTVRLSRQIFPGLKSYSLGRICEHAGIVIQDRHRAYGDAAATATLFGCLITNDREGCIPKALKRNSGEAFLPPNMTLEKFISLPEEVGVYYFHDLHGKVIYVGKALNIKSRFKAHFSGGSKSSQAMKAEVHEVSFELTGSDFLAQLLEALEIKRLWPKYNRSQKVRGTSWGIYSYEDALGYKRFQIAKVKPFHAPLFSFVSHAEAWKLLLSKIDEYRLCPKLCGIQKSSGACYAFQDQKCNGACCGKEDVESYNAKIGRLIQSLEQQPSKLLIKEKGRTKEEQAAILFDGGFLSAYGFIDNTTSYNRPEEVVFHLKKVKTVPETQNILRYYLANAKSDILELQF